MAEHAQSAAGPLLVVSCETLTREQDAFFSAWAMRQPVILVRFAPEFIIRTLILFLANLIPKKHGVNLLAQKIAAPKLQRPVSAN